jgi:hypothetical protein
MKSFLSLTLAIVGLLMAGCAHHQAVPTTQPVKPAVTAPQTIVTPDTLLTAKVVRYNSVARFVVLRFPVGQMPKLDQSFFLYRDGLKVGEVKITGPQLDNNIDADLVSGEAQVGDEVRDR